MTTFELAQVLFVKLGGAGMIAAPFAAGVLLLVLLHRWYRGW